MIMKKIKKLDKKTKKKLINIAETIFTVSINVLILVSLFTKEYGVGIILMLLQIYIAINTLDLTVKTTIQIPNNETEIKTKKKKIEKNRT